MAEISNIRSVKGMHDLLPASSRVFSRIEAEMRRVFSQYGFSEIRTPVVEETRLFSRGIGEETDIVAKEMYTFLDRDGTSLSLRPENTASAVRAYIEHGMAVSDPVARWYYAGPMFRHERAQKGRYRQFHQIGAEIFGISDAAADAELMHMLMDFAAAVGVSGGRLGINSLGCAACRPAYREALKSFAVGVRERLCEDCGRRIETNPLRVLDCKKEPCRAATENAPASADHLCADCAAHFARLRSALDAFGDTYEVDRRMVRGLDYYNRTTFELSAAAPAEEGGDGAGLGAQNAIAGGGRYDGLVEILGGRPTPAVGFAVGLERLAMLSPWAADPLPPAVRVFVMAVGEGTLEPAAALASGLRRRGVSVEFDGSDKGFKAKFKRADKSGAVVAAIVGEDEARRGVCAVKSMTAAMLPGGEKQAEVPVADAAAYIETVLRHEA
ncbi:MAG: histidine--tRNA ligase [Deltaproteobacteria bacterium]|nr:histidine--tRNA ligase [Deltaproteobacteria bacterium]